jgi:hypothetical protein
MDRLPENVKERFQIEQAIVQRAKSIQWDTENRCFQTSALSDFIESWLDLAEYYRVHSDLSIGVDTMREYLYWIEKLAEIKLSPATTTECRQEVEEALNSLKSLFWEIVKQVDYQLYPEGR